MSELTAFDALRSLSQRRNAIRQSAAVYLPAERNGSSLGSGGHIARWTKRHVPSGWGRPHRGYTTLVLRAQNFMGAVGLSAEMATAGASFTCFFA